MLTTFHVYVAATGALAFGLYFVPWSLLGFTLLRWHISSRHFWCYELGGIGQSVYSWVFAAGVKRGVFWGMPTLEHHDCRTKMEIVRAQRQYARPSLRAALIHEAESLFVNRHCNKTAFSFNDTFLAYLFTIRRSCGKPLEWFVSHWFNFWWAGSFKRLLFFASEVLMVVGASLKIYTQGETLPLWVLVLLTLFTATLVSFWLTLCVHGLRTWRWRSRGWSEHIRASLNRQFARYVYKLQIAEDEYALTQQIHASAHLPARLGIAGVCNRSTTGRYTWGLPVSRHHHLLAFTCAQSDFNNEHCEQGFVTYGGQWLTRAQAAECAKALKHTLTDAPINGMLFSEDIF